MKYKGTFNCPMALENMELIGDKRFCGKCSRHVYDLRGKSDVEVGHLLSRGDICAVIETVRIKPANWWLRAAIGITSFLALQTFQLKAQFRYALEVNNFLDYTKQKHLMGGKVVDSRGHAVEDARIELRDIFGNLIADATTGKLGLFRIEFPYSRTMDSDIVELKVYRYRMTHITKRNTLALIKKEDLRFNLGEEHYYEGGIPMQRVSIDRIHRTPVDYTKMRNIANRMSEVKLDLNGSMNN